MTAGMAKVLLIILASLVLYACGENGFFEAEPSEFNVQAVTLGTDAPNIRSDSSTKATLSASVLDENNGAVEGVTVVFSADSGQLSKSTAVTDDSGVASVTLTSGNADKSNRTITIAATAEGSRAQIPIEVVGTAVEAQGQSSNLTTDGATIDTVTVTVKDAGINPINAAIVSTTVSGTGNVIVSLSTTATNTSGQLIATVTGSTAGSATVNFTSMGVTSSLTYTIAGASSTFGITSPAKTTPIASIEVNSSLMVTIQAPTQANATLVSTLGTWNGGSSQAVTVAVSGGVASATLTSAVAGTASIQAFDAADPNVTDTVEFGFTIPVSSAANIILKSNITAVAPSMGTSKNIAILTAKVSSASGQPVQGAVVYFTLEQQTSSGENLNPVSSVTNAAGEANSTFTSGALPTGQNAGVIIKATVLGTAFTDTETITVGGSPGSVTIGRATVIEHVHNNTAYKLPMAVLVTDSNGSAIEGATVTVKVWPSSFSSGFYDYILTSKLCVAIVTGTFANEDINENLEMDLGEDAGYISSNTWSTVNDGFTLTTPVVNVYTADGVLTPPNTAAGGIDNETMVTGATGVAEFNLIYTKVQANYIVARIRASVQAQGTETINEYSFPLPASAADTVSVDACFMPSPSPYGR